jgi:hypothetical protein
MFNNSNKCYCELEHQVWLDKYAFGTISGPAVKKGSGVIAGHKVTEYECGVFIKKKDGSFTVENFHYQFWMTNDLNLPAKMTNAYSALCAVPPNLGIPLRIYRHYGTPGTANYRKTVFLDTYQVQPVSLVASDYTPPSGYRKVADEMDILMADEVDDLLSATASPGAGKSAVRSPHR